MNTEVDLFAPVKPARMKGQGRRGLVVEAKVADILSNEGDIDYAVARARKEAWAAKTIELDYRIKQDEYVHREQVQQVCATAFAALTQALRSLPDALERREGVTPELAGRIAIAIDDTLSALAIDFEVIAGSVTDE
jgi:hypothetical protein